MKRISVLLIFAVTLLLPSRAIASGDEITAWSEESIEVFQTEEYIDNEPWVETMSSSEEIPLNAKSALLMERETGTVIYSFNEHERLAPASVTKIMTLLLIMESLDSGQIKLSDLVTASAHAAEMGGSQIFLREYEQMTVDDMLKSIAVGSANDASVAMAEHISGSEDAFVAKMNAKAKALGMSDTVFANCTGLPSKGEHLTSAYDIAVMSRELLKYPAIRGYTTIWTDSIRNGEFGLSNTNKLIRFFNGATGLKTGFTDAAKYCVSATAERDGIEYIAVIMGSPTSAQRFDAAKVLLNHAFATYTLADIYPETPIEPIGVTLGEADFVQPVPVGDSKLLVEKSALNSLQRTVTIGDEQLTAPIASGQEVGRLVITDADGKILADVPLCADKDVNRLTWLQIFVRYLSLLFVG